MKKILVVLVVALGVSLLSTCTQEAKRKPEIERPQPEKGEERRPTESSKELSVVTKALDYLAHTQRPDGFWEAGNGGTIVATSLAGLAFLASGSTLKDGPYAENLRKAAKGVSDFIKQHYGGGIGEDEGSEGSRTGWHLSFAAMFLSEVYRIENTPELKQVLQLLVKSIQQTQLDDGGWSHAKWLGAGPFAYGSFATMTTWNLFALGLLKKAGFEVLENSIKKGADYLEKCTHPDGSIDYNMLDQRHLGMKIPRRGAAGRTLGAIFTFACTGQKAELRAKMAEYIERTGIKRIKFNESYTMLGHEPHFYLTAALGSWSLGKKSWENYLEVYQDKILEMFEPDKGQFKLETVGTPGTEKIPLILANGLIGSSGGINWTTATYALILQMETKKLKFLQELDVPTQASKEKPKEKLEIEK